MYGLYMKNECTTEQICTALDNIRLVLTHRQVGTFVQHWLLMHWPQGDEVHPTVLQFYEQEL